MKVDAPSGTALLLGQAAAEGRGVDLAATSVRGRDGITGARETGSIGFASLRGGLVAGDHTVHFLSDYEHISLRHHAEDRQIFAKGAIRAGQWLIGKAAGAIRWPRCLVFDPATRSSSSSAALPSSIPRPRPSSSSANTYQLLVAVVLSAQGDRTSASTRRRGRCSAK